MSGRALWNGCVCTLQSVFSLDDGEILPEPLDPLLLQPLGLVILECRRDLGTRFRVALPARRFPPLEPNEGIAVFEEEGLRKPARGEGIGLARPLVARGGEDLVIKTSDDALCTFVDQLLALRDSKK